MRQNLLSVEAAADYLGALPRFKRRLVAAPQPATHKQCLDTPVTGTQ